MKLNAWFVNREDGSTLSMEEVIDNVFTLAFAGTDTTASSLSSAFLRQELGMSGPGAFLFEF